MVNFTEMDLGTLGTEIGDLLDGITDPLVSFLINIAIVGGVIGILGGIVYVITHAIKRRS